MPKPWFLSRSPLLPQPWLLPRLLPRPRLRLMPVPDSCPGSCRSTCSSSCSSSHHSSCTSSRLYVYGSCAGPGSCHGFCTATAPASAVGHNANPAPDSPLAPNLAPVLVLVTASAPALARLLPHPRLLLRLLLSPRLLSHLLPRPRLLPRPLLRLLAQLLSQLLLWHPASAPDPSLILPGLGSYPDPGPKRGPKAKLRVTRTAFELRRTEPRIEHRDDPRALFKQIRDLSCADQILEPSKTKLRTKPRRSPSRNVNPGLEQSRAGYRASSLVRADPRPELCRSDPRAKQN